MRKQLYVGLTWTQAGRCTPAPFPLVLFFFSTSRFAATCSLAGAAVDTAVRSGIPSGGESRAGQSFRGCPRRRTGGESATNVFCAILYVLRGHSVGRGRRGGKRARVRHLRRRRRRGGRTAARTREASAGGGEPLALPPADREEGRVGQGLRVGKPATVASRTSGNRGRRAMAIGGESCGARRRCIGYGV